MKRNKIKIKPMASKASVTALSRLLIEMTPYNVKAKSKDSKIPIEE